MKRILFTFFLGLVLVATLQFEARADLRLRDSIKSALAAGKPVRGDRCAREMSTVNPCSSYSSPVVEAAVGASSYNSANT